MKIDTYTYGLGQNSVLVVNRAIVGGLREAGLLRTDHTPPLNPGVDWEGVGRMKDQVEPGADVAVCQASVCLEVINRIKEVSPGTKIVLQRDSTHCKWWKRLVEGEMDRFGIRWEVYGGGLLQRELQEYELADHVTVLSRWVQRTFEAEGLGDKTVYVGPQTFDRDRWPTSNFVKEWTRDVGGHRFRVLFAGQTGLRKGLFHLLEAWTRLALPNGELVIAGLPETNHFPLVREVERRIKGTQNVTDLKFVPFDRMADLYADCHVLCIPSVEEGSTMTGIEALSTGRPVVATPNAGIDVLEHGVNGLEVEPGSWESIADALAHYYEHPGVWTMHAGAASESVAGCDVPEFGARYVERLRGIIR